MRKVLTTPRFERRLRSFLDSHPDLEAEVADVMHHVAADTVAGLRVHPLKGVLKGCRAAKISYEYRVVFVSKRGSVCFVDIGTHDDVYR